VRGPSWRAGHRDPGSPPRITRDESGHGLVTGADEPGDTAARPDGPETRRRRRWMTVAVVGVLTVATAATWALAGQARTPRELAAAASAPPKSAITVPVRFGSLVRTVGLECAAAPSTRVPVPVPVPPDNGEPVVTALPVKRGGQVSEGKVVMEVSGRPVIVLVGRLPSYRDILPGVSGPDVRQLQRALTRLGLLRQAAGPNGVFDARTRAAVAGLYRARGYPAPGPTAAPDPRATTGQGSRTGDAQGPKTDDVMVPRRELLTVPQLPAGLGTVKTRVGASVKAGDVVIEAGSPVLRCAVPDPGAVQGLAKGAQASVTSPSGSTVRARVGQVTTGQQGGDGQAPQDTTSPAAGQDGSAGGGDQTVTELLLVPERRIKAGGGYQARIEVEKAEHSGPIVPSSALWSRAGDRTVVKIVRSGQYSEASVEPGFEVDGEVAVQAAEGTLRQGDQVLVSGEAGAP
jgi:peptidoglycan hydrolase-like protein with peptidoglycan-binding domain